MFDPKMSMPEMTIDQLRGPAPGLNRAVVASLEKEPWCDLDQAAWEETHMELSEGWMSLCEAVDTDRRIVG